MGADRAVFAESFANVGIVAGDGGAWLLPRIIGFARAAEMAFTGDPIDADQAYEIGLVPRVVPHDHLLPVAYEIAGRNRDEPPARPAVDKTDAQGIASRHARYDPHHGRVVLRDRAPHRGSCGSRCGAA